MAEPSKSRIEDCAQEAKHHIRAARASVTDAAWAAKQDGNNELDKTLMAVSDILDGVIGLLICTPRLKG